jgi:hypothetical protein
MLITTHRLCLSLWIGAALVLLAPAIGSVSAPSSPLQPLTLTVGVDRPGPRVSPSLYGVFFEEINHAGKGGLYGEMVRNRDFEETGPADSQPTGWSIHPEGQAQTSMTVDTARPLNDAHLRDRAAVYVYFPRALGDGAAVEAKAAVSGEATALLSWSGCRAIRLSRE